MPSVDPPLRKNIERYFIISGNIVKDKIIDVSIILKLRINIL
jgi:hypothetical protein